MSLKFFHIVFVSLSTLLALGFAAWCIVMFFSGGHSLLLLLLGLFSLLAAIGLIFYGRYVLKKLKNISYL